LATPTALAAATDRLVRQGVLVVQPHVIETLYRATHIVFDKTGTLTVGKPVLRHIETLGARQELECLRIAALMESHSAHPLASAILRAAGDIFSSSNAVSEVQSVAGKGMEGIIDGVRYRIGNAEFVEQLTHCPVAAMAANDATSLYLGSSDGWLARFDVTDALRDDAHAVVSYFQSLGKTVTLLSGDRREVTERFARALGINNVFADRLPQQKVEYVQSLQHGGAVVAMVGDGINDAAVMRVADVSFAMGSGAALAQTHADGVLLSGRLNSVCKAATTASQTMAVIRQNLTWAMLYNAVAIPAAAIGWLNPWLSGVGMSLSSAIVVMNALRLRRGNGIEKTGTSLTTMRTQFAHA
jgi:Cu2+-exporting ATPase